MSKNYFEKRRLSKPKQGEKNRNSFYCPSPSN